MCCIFTERATSEKNTSEDWGQIMDICDRVKENNSGPRDCLKSVARRLNSENPRVVLQTITVSFILTHMQLSSIITQFLTAMPSKFIMKSPPSNFKWNDIIQWKIVHKHTLVSMGITIYLCCRWIALNMLVFLWQLLDACINNCGRKFLLEVASRDFEQELRKHITSTRTHHKVFIPLASSPSIELSHTAKFFFLIYLYTYIV